jgi:glycosyltransferase involved in cell wall biosynthesis
MRYPLPRGAARANEAVRVAIISQPEGRVVPPVQSGSIGIWTYQVAHRLAKHCDVLVYAPHGPALRTDSITHNGVTYRYVPAAINRICNRALRLIPRRAGTPMQAFASQAYHLGYIVQVARDLRRQNVDVVHIHNYSQFAPIVRRINKDVKIVLHMHCEWLNQLNSSVIARRLTACDLIVGCSDYITDKARTRFPESPCKWTTVYNGVDVRAFATRTIRVDTKTRRPKRKETLVFVGRLSPEKGLHTLMSAFQQVLTTHPESRLALVGGKGVVPRGYLVDLSEEPLVQGLARFYAPTATSSYSEQLRLSIKRGYEDSVIFTDRVDHDRVIDYYHDATMVINPSLSESFGMSLIEGMSAKLPVVATRVGGMVDVVEEGVTGLLVDPDDDAGLADAITSLLGDPDRARKMGEAGYQRAKSLFDWDKVVAATLRAYGEILKPISPSASPRGR